jgi:hypothetical protein
MPLASSPFVWLVADRWCWFVLKEKYCSLITGGWFVLREKYCWLVADRLSEQGVPLHFGNTHQSSSGSWHQQYLL